MAVRLGAVVEQQLGKAFVAVVGNRPARGHPREQAFFDLDALRLGLVFGQADPGHFGVGIGHAGDDTGVEGGAGQFFVVFGFTGDDFGRHMRLVHRLVRQHGLADDVANGKDVRHVGAHLDVDVDEAAVGHRHAGFVGRDFLAVRAAAHGLQHQIVGAFALAAVQPFKLHLDTLWRGLCANGFSYTI